MSVQFISYDGKYPNLCSGTLVFSVNDKEYSIKYGLVSGGGINFFEDNYYVSSGPWSIEPSSFPEELKPYFEEITDMINENIPYGCCGGCV